MKFKVILFLIIVSFAKLNAQKVNGNGLEKSLIGNWTTNVNQITTEKNGKYTTENASCNVCPKVIFTFERNLQNASVIRPNGDRENYIWSIKGDVISFVNIDAVLNLNTFFISSYKYKFELRTKKEYVELELSRKNVKSTIILRKKRNSR